MSKANPFPAFGSTDNVRDDKQAPCLLMNCGSQCHHVPAFRSTKKARCEQTIFSCTAVGWGAKTKTQQTQQLIERPG
jgi:hypothetical protein